MRHLSNYKQFNEELIIQQTIDYINSSINESSDYKSIWDNIVSKLKGLSEGGRRKLIKYGIGTLLAFNTITNVVQIINTSGASPEDKQIAIEMVDQKANKEEEDAFKDGFEFKLSDEGWNHIKSEEKCVLKAYTIGDGKVTVGYGHAEDIGKTKLRKGQKITQAQADKYLKEDLKKAADGVRRIFREWNEDGVDVKITQSMFDALVSLAYNSGVGSLRQSDLIQHIKKGEYKLAGDSIKEYNLNKKFPGLETRREKESEMFLASL
jgi:GH24 family phage-related lysozyme (muramidase)